MEEVLTHRRPYLDHIGDVYLKSRRPRYTDTLPKMNNLQSSKN